LVEVRVFLWINCDDRLSLLNYHDALLRIKAGRYLSQSKSTLTNEPPSLVLDLLEKTQLGQDWDFRRKVWGNEAYAIFSFTVEESAVPMVMPVIQRVLRSVPWTGEGEVTTRISLTLFGYDERKRERLFARWFPSKEDADETAE